MWYACHVRTNAKSWFATEEEASRCARDRMVNGMMREKEAVVHDALVAVCGTTRIPTQLRKLLDAGLLDRKVRKLAERIGRKVHGGDRMALVWVVAEEESEWEDDEW